MQIFSHNIFAEQQPDSSTISTKPYTERVRLGITAGYAYNLHSVNFLNNNSLGLFSFLDKEGKLPPNFQQGVGSGIFAGLVANIPLTEHFSLSLRGSLTQHDALLQLREVYPTRIGEMNQVDTSSFSLHKLSTNLLSIGAEALATWNIGGTGLLLQGGIRGAWLLASGFRYEEEIVSTISNGRGVFLGTNSVLRQPLGSSVIPLPNINNLQFHLLGGLGYEIPIGEKLRITPEVFYAFAITNAFQANTAQPNETNLWALHQIRGGITLTLPLPEPKKPQAPPPLPPEIVKPTSILAIKGVGIQESSDNQPLETESVIVRIQQTISRSVLPLLPYVFFDGINSMSLPERYALLTREQTRGFRETKLSPVQELLPKEHSYYNVLNIVAERLLRYPKATLTIHGCTDNFTAEKNRTDVAKVRGRLVYRYLREVWGIEESRLKMQETPISPLPPSVPLNETEKQAENRRVELRSDTPAVLENITLIDTTRRAIAPRLRFYPRVERLDGIQSWNVVIRHNGRMVKELSGKGAMPPSLDWSMSAEEGSAIHLDSLSSGNGSLPLEYSLVCTDSLGKTHRSPENIIPLETRTEERTQQQMKLGSALMGRTLIERFNLILFDFAKSTVTKEQEPMMRLIQSRITPRSTVRVDGFTDRTGLAEFNQQLSLQRATNVAQMLNFSAEQMQKNVLGYGASVELYNNDLPEGRFYSRTVRVIVETPQSE
jgi:outer membrane protein OmpA-like peptidoglycan-associated protein